MFGFPEEPRPKGLQLKKNLLQSAIFQLKYPKNGDILSSFEELKKGLEDEFPIISTIQEGMTAIKFEKNKTPILQSVKSSDEGFEFRTPNSNRVFSITSNTLTYTIFGQVYENLDNALSKIKEKFFPIIDNFEIKEFTRIAIRKINLMEPTIKEDISVRKMFRDVFSPNLIQNYNTLPGVEMLESGITSLKVKKEDYRLNISYGLTPPNPRNKKPQMLLDLDLFSVSDNIKREHIEDEWIKINTEIFNIFSWALSDELMADLKS